MKVDIRVIDWVTVYHFLSNFRVIQALVHMFLTHCVSVVNATSVFQVDIDFDKEPIGVGKDGKEVYFRDIWPSTEEIAEVSLLLVPNFF